MSLVVRRPYRRRMTTMADTPREALLTGLPVAERRLHLSGVSTAVLEGGDGSPIVLLHGPGEFAATWLRVLPRLARTHRVVVPDLPGHGASQVDEGPLDGNLLGQFAAAPMTPEQLAQIEVPTTLVRGRHDLATPLHVAEAASIRYGWPLQVVEDAGDDPALDPPEGFVEAVLRARSGTEAVS